MQKLSIEQIKEDLAILSNSRIAKLTTRQLERNDALVGRKVSDSVREIISKTHKGKKSKSYVIDAVKEALAKRNAERYSKEAMFELGKKYDSVSSFEVENSAAIVQIRKADWYDEWYEMMGGTTKWNQDKVIECLKQFKSRSEAIKDKQGQKAVLWLSRNNLNNLQLQIWSDFKPGKGYTDNKKLSDDKLEQKVISLAKQLKTTSYTKIARKLRELSIAASDKKVQSILIKNNLI